MRIIVTFLLLAIISAGCDHRNGSGKIVSEKRNVGEFNKLKVSNAIHAEVKRGNQFTIEVETDDNVMDLIETRVENGTLLVRVKDHTSLNNAHTNVYITVPTLSEVEASSAAEIEITDPIVSSEVISFNASSAGQIKSGVDAPTIHADASSGSQINISGRTKDFTAKSSSGSSIKAFELMTENTYAEASSGASVDTHPSVSLTGHASSGANISYKGNAPTIKKEESSGGNINMED